MKLGVTTFAALLGRLLMATLAAPLASPLAAQQAVPLAPGAVHVDSLGTDEIDRYTLDLEAGQFVLGHADQRTVDVVVSIFGPDGARIARLDGPARGAEVFQFDTEAAGEHRIEVAPFEGESGTYAIVLERVEPVATGPEARVDQLMARYTGDATPGGVVGVIRDGELVFARSYGAANLTHRVPFDTGTITNIGSTSKQFTAFAIALLAERGALSLDDDIRTHIPELPDFGQSITLRHLLTHTSGYREFINALALAGRRFDEGDHVGRYEVLELVRRQPELQNDPGEEFNYNNSGFSLLTLVVERITGESFPDWMRENVFEPLGMRNTLVRPNPTHVIRNSAQGYVPAEEGGWREISDLGASMGAGGIYTTVADLARWIDNLDEPRVGSPAIVDRMTERYVLTTGDTTRYGLGLFIDEYRGLRRIHHGGADIAHRSMLRYFPKIDAAVVTLSNNATFNSNALSNEVVDAFFADYLEPEEEGSAPAVAGEFDPETYDPEDFDPLTGRYALDAAPSMILTFFREGDTLFTQATGQPRVEIEPTSDSTFQLTVVPASLTFHRNPDGTADSVTLHQNGDHLARRVAGEVAGDGWEPTEDELEAYTGRYFSRELETFYTIAIEEGDLVLRHRRFPDDLELKPGTERDAFTGSFPIAQLKFLRDEAGAVTGLEASNVRTRGVRFDRVDDQP